MLFSIKSQLIGSLHALILVLFCMLFFENSFSQEKSNESYGLKAGINFAELFGQDAIPESDRKVGYSLGAFGSFKINKELKLQAELIWSLQGEKSENKGRYDITYLNIPLMFKWTTGNFYTELGPQLGILTISTKKSVPDSIRLNNFETFDVAINAGFGYNLDDEWSIGFRYCQGVTNLVRGRDLKNSVIYLGISFTVF